MKKLQLQLLAMLMVALTSVGFVSCGGDDDDKIIEPEELIGSVADLQGVWSGYTSDRTKAVVLGFSNNATGLIMEYTYSSAEGDYVKTTSDFVNFNYSYNPYGGLLKAEYTNYTYSSPTWRVKSLTSEKMTIVIGGVTYNCEKYQDTGEVTDYAPSDVSNKHVYIGLHSYSLDLYFDSNYSVDMTYSKMTRPFTLVSASYSKTGTNKAAISYTWSGSTGTHTETVTLTFTSDGGGTADNYPYSGTFTIEDFARASSAAAPANISYMTLSVPYGTDTWYKFGAQTLNQVSITSYSGSLRYESIYATYSRTSTTTATITIYKSFSSYTSTSQERYTLDFYTATSGKYSFYSSHGSFGTSSWTGDFTLQ